MLGLMCVCRLSHVKGSSECSGKRGPDPPGENFPRVQPHVGPPGRGDGGREVPPGDHKHRPQPLLRERNYGLSGCQPFTSRRLGFFSHHENCLN